LIGANRNQSEQGVVVAAIDPDLIGQRRTHSATAGSAVAAITASRHEFLVTFLCDFLEVLIRALERAFLGALGDVLRIATTSC
jgi:hypothetical protein